MLDNNNEEAKREEETLDIEELEALEEEKFLQANPDERLFKDVL